MVCFLLTLRDPVHLLTMIGLHLTSDGYKIMFDVVMETIHKNWPDQDTERLPMVHPGWVDAPQ